MKRNSRETTPDRPRIFGIGLNKTGTTTFDKALTILGFTTLHYGGPEIHNAVQLAIDDGEPLLSHIDPRYDAFSDIGLLSRRFRALDAQYSGSKFILTMRSLDIWIDSRRRHVQRNLERKAAGAYDGTFLVVDEAKWRAEWESHIKRAREFFRHRDNFLEVDLTLNPQWQTLCDFLGVPVPTQPFPWANRDKSASADLTPLEER
jgi:hypothetical protein